MSTVHYVWSGLSRLQDQESQRCRVSLPQRTSPAIERWHPRYIEGLSIERKAGKLIIRPTWYSLRRWSSTETGVT